MATQRKRQTVLAIKADATEYATNTTISASDYSAHYELNSFIEDKVERQEIEGSSFYGLLESIESKSKAELSSVKMPLMLATAEAILKSIGKFTLADAPADVDADIVVDDSKISVGGTYTTKPSVTTFTLQTLDGNNKTTSTSSKPTSAKLTFKIGEYPTLETGFEGIYAQVSDSTIQAATKTAGVYTALRNPTCTLNGVALDFTELSLDVGLGTESILTSTTANGYAAPEVGLGQITATIKIDPLKTAADVINALEHSNTPVDFVFMWANKIKFVGKVIPDSNDTKEDNGYGRYDLILKMIVDTTANSLFDFWFVK